MQAHNPPHRHARTALSATLVRMQQHNLPHTRLHNLPHSALLVVCATQAGMQLHNLPCRHARTALSATQACMQLHNLPHMRLHNLHTGMHVGHVVASATLA